MKQKINIKKFIDEHSEAIAVTVSGVAIIVAFTLGHKIGRHVGEADCNRLWNEACDAAGVDRSQFWNWCNNTNYENVLICSHNQMLKMLYFVMLNKILTRQEWEQLFFPHGKIIKIM